MSRDYADKKIKQALQVNDNDIKRTSRDIIELCVRDHDFLLGITEPFLRGIIGHSVQRVAKPALKTSDKKLDPAPKMLDVETLSAQTGLGADIVKTVMGSKGHKFGTQDKTRSTLGRKTKASKKHVDAMKMLASGSKKITTDDV